MKWSVSRIGLAMAAPILALAGCHDRVAPVTRRGIVVSQARLVLPAVKGNPGAAYFTLRNGGDAAVTLVQVDIAGAQTTQMHETSGGAMTELKQVRIAPGQDAIFAPAARHVMAFSLAPALAAGSAGRIVLHFQDGQTIAAPLRIEAAGGGDDMAGMKMDGNR